MVKKYFNKKIILGGLAMVLVFVIIIVSSIFPLLIDPSKWASSSFISNEIIVSAITIMSMVCMMFIGQAVNAQDEKSKLAKARASFFLKRDVIKDDKITAFQQRIKFVLEPRDQSAKIERVLQEVGIVNRGYLNLSLNDLKSLLLAPQKIENVYFKQLTKKQYKAIKNIIAGKEKISFVAPESYLKAQGMEEKKTISEKQASKENKKIAYLAWSIFYKLTMALIIGFIFTSLVYDSSHGKAQAEIWMNLASRLSAMTTSSFFGFVVGQQINDIDADYTSDKTLVIEMFLSDKEFKAKTEQELAREERIEKEKKERLKQGKLIEQKEVAK
jgi:hypothetical protein